jgi:hypothetical protein
MTRKCEACPDLGRTAKSGKAKKICRILVENRLVLLCETHAKRVRELGPESVEKLRQLFRERGGKRSRVERRSAMDRRVFPARPEGRRGSTGRRAGDADAA